MTIGNIFEGPKLPKGQFKVIYNFYFETCGLQQKWIKFNVVFFQMFWFVVDEPSLWSNFYLISFIALPTIPISQMFAAYFVTNPSDWPPIDYFLCKK